MNAITLWIPGLLPGLNELFDAAKSGHGRGNAYSRLKKKWTNDIALLAKAKRTRYLEPVHINFEWREPNRRRDPDNFVAGGRKLVLDGLVRSGMLNGDGWAHISGWHDSFCVMKPAGVMLTIWEVGP